MVTVMGLRCSKENLDWVVIEGSDMNDAVLVGWGKESAPKDARGAQLVWMRKEIQELLGRHQVEVVALRAVEPGGMGNSLPRAEVEGVAQEAVAATGLGCQRIVSATLRSAFGAKNGAQLAELLEQVEITAATPKSRREVVAAALAAMVR